MENFFWISLVLLWIVVIFNLILTLGVIRRVSKLTSAPDFENVPTLGIGTQAPYFSAETTDGQSVNLTTYADKSTTFIFVSPTCNPCIEQLPNFQKIEPYAKRHDVGITLVSLTDKKGTQSFVDKYSITLPTLVAPQENNSFSKDYMVAGTPFYCIIDKNGKIQSTGFLDSKWDQITKEWITTS